MTAGCPRYYFTAFGTELVDFVVVVVVVFAVGGVTADGAVVVVVVVVVVAGVVVIVVTAIGGTVTTGGLVVIVPVADVTGGTAVGGTVSAGDGFVVVVAADTAGPVLVAGVVLVMPAAAEPVFVVVFITAIAVALCIASGIWTTVAGIFPVTGAKDTISAFCAMLAGLLKSRSTAQSLPVTAGKVTFC